MSVLMLFRIASYYVVVAVSAVGFFFAQKECQKNWDKTHKKPASGRNVPVRGWLWFWGTKGQKKSVPDHSETLGGCGGRI